MNRAWPWARLAGAALILAAIAVQLAKTVEVAAANDRDMATTAVNFLSFFTIQSNIIGMIALVVGAIIAWRSPAEQSVEPRWYAVFLACATTYLLTTGIVYNTLLRGIELPQGTTVPWSNEVLHVVAPLVLLADLMWAPRRRPLPWGAIISIAAYPVAWVVYTLLRGPFTVNPTTGEAWWYPYPFLNPHVVAGGYLGVAAYVAGIAIAIIAIGALVVWWGRKRALRSAVPLARTSRAV